MFSWITPPIWLEIIRNAFEPDIGEQGVAEAIQTWNEFFAKATDYHAQIRPFVYIFTQNTNRSTLRIKLSSQLIQAMHQYAQATGHNEVSAASSDLTTPTSRANEHMNVRSLEASLNASQPSNRLVTTPVVTTLTQENKPTTYADVLALVLVRLYEMLFQTSDTTHHSAAYLEALRYMTQQNSLGLDSEQLKYWAYWSQQPLDRGLDIKLSIQQCNVIITQAYVFLSEATGPVVADELLDTVMSEVQKTAAGKIYSPRLFL